MDLLDRYLQAVKFWLPEAQKQDIIAELSEDLRSQIEEQETALGRPATKAEVEAILRKVGPPVLVANRYLPPQYLIGPVWFPIYAFVLKIVGACYLVPWIVVWVGLMIFNPAYRSAHAGGGWLGALGEAWSGLWLAAVIAIGTVTTVFAVLEKAQAKSRFLEHWDPGKLPPVRDPNRIPRVSSAIDLVANIVFGSWWTAMMWSPVVFDRSGVRITLASNWHEFFLGFLALAVIKVASAAVNLLRPYWTRARAGVRLATNFAGSALLCVVCRSNIVADIRVAGVAAARTVEITQTIDRVMSQAFPLAVAVGLVVLAVDIRRIVRAKSTDPQSRSGVTARRMDVTP